MFDGPSGTGWSSSTASTVDAQIRRIATYTPSAEPEPQPKQDEVPAFGLGVFTGRQYGRPKEVDDFANLKNAWTASTVLPDGPVRADSEQDFEKVEMGQKTAVTAKVRVSLYQSEVMAVVPPEAQEAVKKGFVYLIADPSSDFPGVTHRAMSPDEVKSQRIEKMQLIADRQQTRINEGKGGAADLKDADYVVISDEAGTRMGRIFSADKEDGTVVGKDSAFGAFTAERSDVRLANAKEVAGFFFSNDPALLKVAEYEASQTKTLSASLATQAAAAKTEPSASFDKSKFAKLPRNEDFEEFLERGVRARDLLATNEVGQSLAHYLVSQNRMGEVDAALFTTDVLSQQDRNGNTPLHWASATGAISNFPDVPVSGANTVLNGEGKNFLHVAEQAGNLNRVPKDFFDVASVTQLDRAGNAVNRSAAETGQVKFIPSEFIPPGEPGAAAVDDAFEVAVLEQSSNAMAKDFAAIYNDEPAPWKIPTEELTTKDLLVQNDSGRSVLERVMEGNEWHKLAPGVVTEACLLLPVSGSGETMAHYIADNAAGYGCEEIPPQVREATTARVLMKTDMEGARNGRGLAVAVLYAGNGWLESLKDDPKVVTEFVLGRKDLGGNSVAEIMAEQRTGRDQSEPDNDQNQPPIWNEPAMGAGRGVGL